MASISGNPSASSTPIQSTEQASVNVPKALEDPALQALVASAVHVKDELADVTNRLAQVDILKRKTTELQAKLHSAIENGASAATVAAYQGELKSIGSRLQELGGDTSEKVAALAKIRELIMARDTLQNQLNEGDLNDLEKQSVSYRMARIEADLEAARFDASGRERGERNVNLNRYRLDLRTTEANTLRSQLKDGGLTPQEEQEAMGRLNRLDRVIQVMKLAIDAKETA